VSWLSVADLIRIVTRVVRRLILTAFSLIDTCAAPVVIFDVMYGARNAERMILKYPTVARVL
jgi:hypothetical protein